MKNNFISKNDFEKTHKRCLFITLMIKDLIKVCRNENDVLTEHILTDLYENIGLNFEKVTGTKLISDEVSEKLRKQSEETYRILSEFLEFKIDDETQKMLEDKIEITKYGHKMIFGEDLGDKNEM